MTDYSNLPLINNNNNIISKGAPLAIDENLSLNSSSNSSKSANDLNGFLRRGSLENQYLSQNNYHQIPRESPPRQKILTEPSKRIFNTNAQNYAQIQKPIKFPDSGRRSAPLFGGENENILKSNNDYSLTKNETLMVIFILTY